MSLQDILGGGAAGAGGPGGPPSGPPPDPFGGGPGGPPSGPPPGGGSGAPDTDLLLGTAIDALHQYISADSDADEIEKSTVAQCIAKLQTIKAQDQKNSEAAMGTQPAHKAMGKVAARLAASQ